MTTRILINIRDNKVIGAIQIRDTIFGYCPDNNCLEDSSTIELPEDEFVESIQYGRSTNLDFDDLPCTLIFKTNKNTYQSPATVECGAADNTVEIPRGDSIFEFFEQNVKTRLVMNKTYFDGFKNPSNE